MSTGERTGQIHLSIGEVLALVQADFPDITISKIRFLESQGLLDPERTPSGYRKFYDEDIERLQWILLQQRDHFLPLKVIRDRLDEWDATGHRPGDGARPGDAEIADGTAPAPGEDGDVAGAAAAGAPTAAAVPEREDVRRAAASLAAGSAMEVVGHGDPATSDATSAPADDAPGTESTDPVESDAVDSGVSESDAVESGTAEPGAAGSDAVESDAVGSTSIGSDTDAPTDTAPVEAPAAPRADLRVGPDDSAMTADELATRAGVAVDEVRELESFSMIESTRVGPDTYYDQDALRVVRACQPFLAHGIEVRHLRMYKIAAEREAGVFEQLVMPYLKQRNPDARARAVDVVETLAEAGEQLHAALLRESLRRTLG